MGQSEYGLHPLRKERRQRNLTQRDLADLAGISLSTIQRAEQGRPIRVDCRRLLCACLGKTAQELGLVEKPVGTEDRASVESSLPVAATIHESAPADSGNTLFLTGPIVLRNPYRSIDLLGQNRSDLTNLPSQQVGAWLAMTANDLAILLESEASWSVESLLHTLQMIIQGVQAMPKVTRRRLLQLGAAAVVSSISVPTSSHVTAQERMQLCQALGESIAAGWKMLYTVSNAQMGAIAQAHLFLVQQNHALLYPQARSLCYTGAYSQIGITLHFQEHDEEALQAYQSSYIAALETGDRWYVAQSLICQSDSYHALGQYRLAIEAIEEALRVIGTADDERLLRARAHLLTCWADNAMMLADDFTAQEKLETAATYLDQLAPNEEFDLAGWLLLAGKYALKTENYAKAKDCFEKALHQLPDQWMLRRVMTAIGLAMAYAHLKERGESLALAETLVPMVQGIDATMTNRWFHQYLQRDLLGTFPTDEQTRTFVSKTYRQLPHLTRLSGNR